MGLKAGKLDRRITIQRINDTGDSNDTWSDVAVLWATKRDVRATERFAERQTIAEIDVVFTIRYPSFPISPDKNRVAYGGRTYDITGVTEVGRREGLELSAVARAEEIT
jgi:SPP1 family predicted phage head-tail adaptor